MNDRSKFHEIPTRMITAAIATDIPRAVSAVRMGRFRTFLAIRVVKCMGTSFPAVRPALLRELADGVRSGARPHVARKGRPRRARGASLGDPVRNLPPVSAAPEGRHGTVDAAPSGLPDDRWIGQHPV